MKMEIFRYLSLLKIILIVCLTTASGAASATDGHDKKHRDTKHHDKQMLITQVNVDFDGAELHIIGRNLTNRRGLSRVFLAGEELTTAIVSDSLITAYLPPGTIDGDYLLVVRAGKRGKSEDSYALTIGNVGPQGEAGPQGDTGPQGPTGPQGLKGDKGDKGDSGPIGLRGPQGLKGDMGNTGATGPRGLQGATGATGPQGPAGTLGSYTKTISSFAPSGGWLIEWWAEAECLDENDIAVSGLINTIANNGWGADPLRAHDWTFQDPNSISFHAASYICNQLFGCGELSFTMSVQCLTVP